jgi:hypothetical protein
MLRFGMSGRVFVSASLADENQGEEHDPESRENFHRRSTPAQNPCIFRRVADSG